MKDLPDLTNMSREEMEAEIIGYQSEALSLVGEHQLKHILIDFRVSDYKRNLSESVGHPQQPRFSVGEMVFGKNDSSHEQGFL